MGSRLTANGRHREHTTREHRHDQWAKILESARLALNAAESACWVKDEAIKAIEEARQMRASLDRQLSVLTRQDREPALPSSGGDGFTSDRECLPQLAELLKRAIQVTRADMGNIQIFDSVRGELRIETQVGFDHRFLDFFSSVSTGSTACGMALNTGARVIIEDVAESPIFRGSNGLEVMLDARARAVQSTPLIGRSGHLMGVISTHYRRPRRPSERELRWLDFIARQTVRSIELPTRAD